MPERGAWRLVRRLAGLVAKVVAIAFALALLTAATYEQIGAWRDSRVLKQIGRSVDIGGRTLNIHCTGEGSPTVIFVGGRTAPGYGRQPSAAYPHLRARAGMTALTSVGVTPDLTLRGTMRPLGIYITSCRAQDSSRRSC